PPPVAAAVPPPIPTATRPAAPEAASAGLAEHPLATAGAAAGLDGPMAAAPRTTSQPPFDTNPGSAAAFATAWADAHDKLAAGRYAEALGVLSTWHDDPSLGLEESQRLEDLLGQLAGTVLYSQKDFLRPLHVVEPGETLLSIAAPLAVPWQLLAKINGVADPAKLVAGESLKLVQGPFDAVVSVSRRRLTLRVGGNYAGTFPVVVGRQLRDRMGSAFPVVAADRPGQPTDAKGAVQAAWSQAAPRAITLSEGLAIEGVPDPSALTEDTIPGTSLVVSDRDLADLADILGPGSRIIVRQ
ncbi:MAG: LysM peptidoglycan-binding domain-containing protein, partial [Planctomycetia bacterium]